MTNQPDLTPFPRLTNDQLLQLLTAVEREKQDPDTAWPDCFICHAVVLGWTATLGTASEDERVVTVQPCGHRMTYSVTVGEMLAGRAREAAATEATESAAENPVADALAAELHRRSVRLEELRPHKQPACLGCPAVQVHGEVIGLLGALGIALGGTVPGGTADEMGKAYYDAWRARQAKEGR